MSSTDIKSFVDSFDTVLTDCDGVLWKGNSPIENSPEMIHQFRKLGKKVIYVTNNSTKTRKEYVEKCSDLGFGGSYEEIYTTSFLSAAYLKSIGFSKKVYLYGTKGIADELANHGIDSIGLGPDPVPEDWVPPHSTNALTKAATELDSDVGCVIASIDYHSSYIKMLKAVSYLNNPETIFLATNMDERFPYSKDLVLPGTGSMVMSIITASRRQPKILGKPETFMFEAVKKDFPDIKPERTLMIGDNTKTDIMLGKNCGLKTLMVGSGVDSIQEANRWKTDSECTQDEKDRVPDFTIAKLGDLLSLTKSF